MVDNKAKKLYRLRGETLTLGELGQALVTMLVRPAMNQTVTTRRDEVRLAIGREVTGFAQRRWHDVQVRSVPIASYANILRHFYLRINEMIDIHPGTEQRISLRGWHAETDLGSDRLERRYITCPSCTNALLGACWDDCRAFNLITRNCDQSLNNAAQSMAVANGLALLALSLTGMAFSSRFRLTGLLILIALLLFVVIRWVGSMYNERDGLAGMVDFVGQDALNIVFCPHVFFGVG